MKNYSNFEKLRVHVGHELECVTYSLEGETYNVAIECLDCNEVIVDYDNNLDYEW